MLLRYGIIGAGAIGGFYGGRLANAGKDVHFLFHRDYDFVREHLEQHFNPLKFQRKIVFKMCSFCSSESNFYQQVTDIYATSIDYDPRADITKNFLR